MSRIESHSNVWGLVPAAGRGKRFGGATPKQLIEVGGKPLLQWTLERLLAAGVRGLTVALPEPWLPAVLDRFEVPKEVAWVAGGESRQDSVAACLEACPEEVSLVLVHDGARPAVAISDIESTITAVGGDDGAILGRRVVDTIKQLGDGRVIGTVDRRFLLRAETPQVFRRAVLLEALGRSRAEGFMGTDEASIVERLQGVRINYVLATCANPKLTEPQDLALLEVLLRQAEETG